MTFIARAVTVAAMTFSLIGMIGASTPSIAAELDRAAIPASTTTAFAINNGNTPAPVPAVLPLPAPSAPAPTVEPEAVSFDSLDDAVAAQVVGGNAAEADEALHCLAGAIYFESKGEPLEGQLAVAEVIINRAKSGRYPADVCGVVKQRGQFSFVRGGEIPSVDSGRKQWRTALAVAKVAMADVWDSAAEAALFFNTPGIRPSARATRVASIGNHIFYR